MKNITILVAAVIIAAVATVAMAQLTPTSSGVTPIAPTHPAATQNHHNDDVQDSFGNTAAAPDYWWQYDATNTQLELVSTNADGAGGNIDLITFDDGTDDMIVNGGIYSLQTVITCQGDRTCMDANGFIGGQLTTDVAPEGLMIRSQPAFAGGTRTASNIVIAAGQDETKITIDGADPSVSCADDNDTVTLVRYNHNNSTFTSTLTEGVDWTASASVADTCASLATAVNALSLVSASCTSPDVLISLDTNTSRVTMTESTAGCTTVVTGTTGYINTWSDFRLEQVNSATTPTLQFGDGDTGFYESADDTLNIAIAGSSIYAIGSTLMRFNNDVYLAMGTTAGAAATMGMQYDTGQTPDGVTLGIPTTSRVFTFFEAGDDAVDFAKAQQTNPTVCVQSADGATTADRICIAHNQTDAVLSSDAGNINLVPAGGTVAITGGLVTTLLEENLTAGACTAGTWKVDNTTTRELCRCNDAGTAYDCISVTNANGPTD